MKRPRFNRNAVGSSRGAYVYHSHISYIKEQCEKNKQLIEELVSVKVESRYFIKCFGELKQIDKSEAERLDPTLLIIL